MMLQIRLVDCSWFIFLPCVSSPHLSLALGEFLHLSFYNILTYRSGYAYELKVPFSTDYMKRIFFIVSFGFWLFRCQF